MDSDTAHAHTAVCFYFFDEMADDIDVERTDFAALTAQRMDREATNGFYGIIEQPN